MRIDKSQTVTIRSDNEQDTVVRQLRIGDFPLLGEAAKDRNGADVYQVPEGVEVLGVDPTTGQGGWFPVAMVTHEADCPTARVTAGGRSVIVSTNESLAVFGPEEGRLVRVAPDKAGDRLVPLLRRDPRPFGEFGDRDLGWAMGAWLSDGWCTVCGLGYCKQEKAKRDEFVRIIRRHHENFTVREYAESAGSDKLGDSVKVHLNSRTLSAWWSRWGLVDLEALESAQNGQRSALFKRLPAPILAQRSEELLWGLLSGLLDGDGTFSLNMATGKPRFGCRFATSSEALKDGVCSLLYRLGIRVSVTVTPPRGHSTTAYTIVPSTVDLWAHLGQLSCIGERERAMVDEWMAFPPQKDDRDVIPVSLAEADVLYRTFGTTGEASSLVNGIRRQVKAGQAPRASRELILRHAEALRDVCPGLLARAESRDTLWAPVSSVEDTGHREVFDLCVEDAKVFAVNDGFVVWDTVNVHVPASDAARRQAWDRMRPSRNLLGLADHGIMNKPEKEYMQGLYIASRMREGERPRDFRSLKEAQEAYRRGDIEVDTPIRLLDR